MKAPFSSILHHFSKTIITSFPITLWLCQRAKIKDFSDTNTHLKMGIGIISLVAILLLFSGSAYAKINKVEVVANVNNQVVTNLDLRDRYDFFLKTSKIEISSKEEKLFILNQLILKMIDENVQISEARKLKINVNTKEMQKALEEVALNEGKTYESMKRYFKKIKASHSEYTNQIRTQILWNKIVKRVIRPKIGINQSDIDEMIELQKINDKKISFNISEIFIPFENGSDDKKSLSLARKLSSELKTGGNFKEIARQFSRSASSEFDGEIGWVEETSLDKRILNNIKKLKNKEVSKEVGLDKGYYVFKVNDRKVVSTLSQNDTEQIRQLVFNNKLKSEAKAHLNKIKKESYIRIHQSVIDSMVR